MADDEVLQHRLQWIGKVRHPRDLLVQHLKLDDHVSKELAACGVGKRAVVGQFMDLADVMQKRSAEEKVAVDLRIVLAHQVAGSRKGYDVVEQAPDVCMVQGFRGWSITVGASDFGIGHKRL